MIRTLAVNCAPILDCFKDEGKTAAENASDELVMGVVWALCEFSLLASQQNHSDLSLKAQDDALKRFYQKKGIFRDQKMSKSAKANVDDLLATESHQLYEQKFHKIRAAMEALVFGAEQFFTTKFSIFQVCLNRSRQAATTWSVADCQKAIERLEREIHQVTPSKCKLFDKILQCHKRQLLQEVGTKATGPTIKFARELALQKTAANDKAYGAANITANKRLQFRIRLSDAETEATTWSFADMACVTNQLEREIYGITSNEQMWFKKEFSIHMIEFEACWETIGIQVLQKTIEQGVIHFGYPNMHVLCHISQSIHRMGSGDNFTPDISERLHIANVKEAYRSNNKVSYIRQMLKPNDQCIGLNSMEETLSYLALEGWYDIDSAKAFNLLSATDQGELHAEPICQVSKQSRTSPLSALYHSRYTN